MTIIAVSKGSVYVDSLSSFGGRRFTESKIKKHHLGTWTNAGDPNVALGLLEDFSSSGKSFSDYRCPLDGSSSYTVVYLRDAKGDVYSISVYENATWQLHSKELELSEVSGAGSDFFHACYSIHGNVAEAMKLTAIHNQYCGLPIESF